MPRLIPALRIVLAIATLASSQSACNAEPEVFYHQIEISFQGNGRNIQADFEYECRLRDEGSYSRFVPAHNSILYIAPDNEALLLTSPQPQEVVFCDRYDGTSTPEDRQRIPSFVWIDDIRSPSRVDEIGMGTLGGHRRFNSADLTRYTHTSSQEPPPVISRQRSVPLRGTIEAVHGAPGQGPRLISAARRVATVDFATEDEREAFKALLGPEIVPGIRGVPICNLAATEDGSFYLSQEVPLLVSACPRGRPFVLPARRIRFSMPQAMKLLGNGRWLTGGSDSVRSFIRDERTPVEISDPNPRRRMGSAPEFWRLNVRTVIWLNAGGAELPVGSPTAYFAEQSDQLILFLDDVQIIHFINPSTWSRQ